MKLTEATIKNLNTREITVVDGEGNIAKLDAVEDAPDFDFFDDEAFADDSSSHGLRPDGSSDGLDGEVDFELEGEPELEVDALSADGENGELDALSVDGENGELDALAVDGEGDPELGLGEEEPQEDPDYQGIIRTVAGAFLVYKRKVDDGSYEELWMYNINGNMKEEARIRRSILAGTDIGPQDVTSENGEQESETTTVGNVQYLKITGLPN